ncbi:MAG: trimethylamine methyltransferase family protein [Dehalobacterium sp.]
MINHSFGKSPSFYMWTEDQLRKLHLASLEILERTGVRVYEKEALKLMKDAGAFVKGDLVKIPAWLVEEAIKSAPERVVLADRNKERKVRLEEGVCNFGLGTDLPFFVDPMTNKIRETTIQDVENTAKISEHCANFDFTASLGLAHNVTTQLADLYHFRALATYSSKPILMTATDYDNLKALIDMTAIIVGGYEELRRAPQFVLYAEPISPLVNSKEAVEKLLLCAEYGIPVTYSSGIIAGATGPATVAGSLALGNAEGLAGLVMHQLKSKGAPFIYGIVFSVMDMHSAISCYGGPELPLGHTIVGQLGKFYGLPTYGTAGCSDACEIDAQAGMESVYSNLLAALSGTNLVHDNGYLASGLAGSLEKMLLDDESIGFVKRFMEGIGLTEDTLALDLIHEVGPGGNFLQKDHTYKHFRKETWYPRFFNRKHFENWIQAGQKTTKDLIRARVLELLGSDKPKILTEKIQQSLEEIINENEKRINKKENK